MGFSPHKFRLTIDGRTLSFRATEVVVANSSIVGFKPFHLYPEIRLNDGKLAVCRIRANNLVDYIKLGWSMLLGKQDRNLKIVCLDVKDYVEIQTSQPIAVQGDGDLITSTPVIAKLQPRAIKIITPV
jgi:diacylglycerol kinase family enzyme